MIKNIIFDLGGVVVSWQPEEILKTFTGNPALPGLIKQSPFFLDIWAEFDRGTIDKAGLIKQAAQISGCSEEECEAFLDHIKSSLTDIPQTASLIRSLSESGYRLFCLSNMSIDFYDYLKERDVFSYFEGQVISAKERLIKPDARIYELILDRYNLQASETLFIDDLEANINAARACGIHTVHFTGGEQVYTDILNQLKD